MSQPLRVTLREGGMAIGLAACVLRTAEIVVVTRSCGFDWLLIDTEHSPIALADVAGLSIAARAAGLPALVRVSGPDAPDLARVLDCGAEGIVVPHVETAAHAHHVVERCRFAPHGKRSVPGPLAGFGFRMPPVREMTEAAERETTVVTMIESAAGTSEAVAIAAMPGVDALMVGANDLAADLGHPGELGHPEVLAAFREVAAAARAHGKVFGVIGLPEALLVSHGTELGARLIVATNDINLLVEGGMALRERCRGIAGG